MINILLNMAANRRCHQHLANKQIVEFVILIFQKHIFENYDNQAENDALYRTIKGVLYICSRLIVGSALCRDVIEHNILPVMMQSEQQLYECKRTPHRSGLLKNLQQFNDRHGRRNASHDKINVSENESIDLSQRRKTSGHKVKFQATLV